MTENKKAELLDFTTNILTVGLGAHDLLHFLVEKKGCSPEDAAALIFEAKRLVMDKKSQQ